VFLPAPKAKGRFACYLFLPASVSCILRLLFCFIRTSMLKLTAAKNKAEIITNTLLLSLFKILSPSVVATDL